MILNEINKNYNKLDVLTLFNLDPKILNRLVVAYFRSKGLYEEYYAKRTFRTGNETKDWEKGFNSGRYFDLVEDPSGRGDIAYRITIGFIKTKAYIQITIPGIPTKEYNFSIINLNVNQLMDKVWEKMQNPVHDREESQAAENWKPIQNAVKKRFNKFRLWVNPDNNIIRFVFSPNELNSIFSDKKMRRALRDIYNPSNYSRDDVWMMKESIHDVETAMKYIYMRMLKLGYFFYTYEGDGLGRGDYIVFAFSKEDMSDRRDSMRFEEAIERLEEKTGRYGDINDFYKKTIVKLFDPKVANYWSDK